MSRWHSFGVAICFVAQAGCGGLKDDPILQFSSAEALEAHQGRCPLQQAGYRVAQMPLFHLINRPPLGLLHACIAQRFADAA